MKRVLALLILAVAVCGFATMDVAAQKDGAKDTTIEGKIGCAKCDLKVQGQTKCAVVVYTTDKEGKNTIYWFDAENHKKYHGDVCQATFKGTVSGTVKKDGDKNVITVKELKFNK